MATTALLALTVLLSGAPKGDDAKPYAIDVAGTTLQVKTGKEGVLKLQIKPAKGYHVSAEAPLKIALTAPGLALKKKALGHDDASEKAAAAPKFEVGFGAGESGKRTIEADAMFFVCSETVCEKKTEKLSVDVDVQP